MRACGHRSDAAIDRRRGGKRRPVIQALFDRLPRTGSSSPKTGATEMPAKRYLDHMFSRSSNTRSQDKRARPGPLRFVADLDGGPGNAAACCQGIPRFESSRSHLPSRAIGITLGPDGNIWFVESQPGQRRPDRSHRADHTRRGGDRVLHRDHRQQPARRHRRRSRRQSLVHRDVRRDRPDHDGRRRHPVHPGHLAR